MVKAVAFFQNLCDLTLRCDGVYNKQILLGFYVEGISLGIRNSMCRWWVDNGEAILADLPHQAQSLLDLQGF